MKRVDDGEFYSSPANLDFSEYKVFKAEEYYGQEIGKTANEDFAVPEFGTDTPSVSREENVLDARKLQEEAGKIDSSSPTPSSTSTTAASNSANAVTESTAVASGATASTVVTAAAVVVVVTSTVAIGLSINEIKREIGANYISLGMNLGDFEKANESSGDPNREYMWHVSTEGEDELVCPALEGEHNYLFANLTRNKEYSLTLQAHGQADSAEVYYEETFKTADTSAPTALIDEFNTGFVFDAVAQEVTFNYEIFVSDIDHQYYFYEVSFTSDDYENTVEGVDNYNFMRGSITGKFGDTLEVKALGVSDNEEAVLLEKTFTIPYPEGWEYPSFYTYEFEDPSYCGETPTSLNIKGNVLGKSTVTDYRYGITMVDANEGILSSLVGDLDIANGEYQFTCDLPYGVNKYFFDITYLDEDGTPVLVFSSQEIALTVSQEYGATYKRPDFGESGCSLTYQNDGSSIHLAIDTEFDGGQYPGVYALRGSVIDTVTNEVLDSDVITSPLLEFNFPRTENELMIRYEEIGYFANNEEHVYAEYEGNARPSLKIPTLSLGADLVPVSGELALPYQAEIPIGFTSVTVDVEIIQNGATLMTVSEAILESGNIVIPNLIDQSGEVTVETKIRFVNLDLPNDQQEIDGPEATYQIIQSLSVEEFLIDLTGTTKKASAKIEYAVAGAESVVAVDPNNPDELVYEGPLSNEFEIDAVPSNATSLEIQIRDADGNVLKSATITIDDPDTSALDYTFSCANPGDSVVTYNEDGTMNCYRDLSFEDRSGGISWSASLYEYDDDYNYVEKYPSYGASRYSIIEDIDCSSFLGFVYYLDYEPNADGVKYRFFQETPSGGIDPLDTSNSIFASREVNEVEGVNEFKLSVTVNGYTKNEFKIGTETKQFNSFEMDGWSTYEYSSNEDFLGEELTFYFTEWSNAPDNMIAEGVPIKGERFIEITKTIT